MNFAEHLSTNNIKPSLQRIKIFEYLHNNKEHPTVDAIYKGLSDDIPTLSKTTIYNTLKLFVENGISKTFSIEGNEARYDTLMKDHAHFKCSICNYVYDIEIKSIKLNNNQISNFQIDGTSVTLKGICNKCLTK